MNDAELVKVLLLLFAALLLYLAAIDTSGTDD
jgi:hypothetical protein